MNFLKKKKKTFLTLPLIKGDTDKMREKVFPTQLGGGNAAGYLKSLLPKNVHIAEPSLTDSRWCLRGHGLLQSRLKINILRPPHPRASRVNDSVTKIEYQESWNADIRGEEPGYGPLRWKEVGEAVDQNEEDEAEDTEVAAPGLDDGLIRSNDALGLNSFAEAEVNDAAAGPANEARRISETDEPVE